MTASFGVASFGEEGITSSATLMETADMRMYQAKEYGRNFVVGPRESADLASQIPLPAASNR